jgi:hypothetical protein
MSEGWWKAQVGQVDAEVTPMLGYFEVGLLLQTAIAPELMVALQENIEVRIPDAPRCTRGSRLQVLRRLTCTHLYLHHSILPYTAQRRHASRISISAAAPPQPICQPSAPPIGRLGSPRSLPHPHPSCLRHHEPHTIILMSGVPIPSY